MIFLNVITLLARTEKYQRIGILRFVKRVFVDTSVLLRRYYAFVLPILEYCSPVLGSAALAPGVFGGQGLA